MFPSTQYPLFNPFHHDGSCHSGAALAAPARATSSSQTLIPAALGLDVGTTATRASLASFASRGNFGREPPSIVPRPGAWKKFQQYNQADFPSAANFFDTGRDAEECIGYIRDDPNQTPVKMYPYIVRILQMRKNPNLKQNERNEIDCRIKIPQIDHFFACFDKFDSEDKRRRVIGQAQSIFLAHLGQVRSQSEVVAESKALKITKLAATIPPNWDPWTQKFYMLLLKRVWDNLTDDDITLIYESEAIGHWLLNLDAKTRAMKPERLILADFGGHTLSYNTFEIVHRGDEFAFFTLTDANCFHGGSELHSSFVKEKIRKDIAERRIHITSSEEEEFVYKSLMQYYRLERRTGINGEEFSLRGENLDDESSTRIVVKFDRRLANSLYETCFRRPLKELYYEFGRTPDGTLVMLSGGSFSNEHVYEEARDKAAAEKLEYLDWTNSVAADGQRSATVAVGAAVALVSTLSMKQFMSNAAFAVEVRPVDSETVPVVWNSSGPQTVDITLSGRQGADIIITCCPSAPEGAEEVEINTTFELQSLAKNRKGSYTISLDYKERDDDAGTPDRLVLTMTNNRSGQLARTEELVWPVYYDPGARVCFIDIDNIPKNGNQVNEASRLVPSKFKDKKAIKSLRNWEKQRGNHGALFWEHPDDEPLPVPTLEEFELNEYERRNKSPVIELSDSEADLILSSFGLGAPISASGCRKRSSQSRPQEASKGAKRQQTRRPVPVEGANSARMFDSLLVENRFSLQFWPPESARTGL